MTETTKRKATREARVSKMALDSTKRHTDRRKPVSHPSVTLVELSISSVADAVASSKQSEASLHLAPDHPDSDLAPLSTHHYPDADLDPLTRSMSALSVGRPLPVPPVPAVQQQHLPPMVHSHTYSHLPMPPNGHEYCQERRSSFNSVPLSHGYAYTQQPPPPQIPAHDQYPSASYQGYPAHHHPSEFGDYAQSGQYGAPYAPPPPQLGEFERLAHQHYASQGEWKLSLRLSR